MVYKINNRAISLLSVAGKIMARVVLSRLNFLADRVYPENQCGFRPGRSTVDMIFTLSQLQEKCVEQNRPLLMAFIDLTKAGKQRSTLCGTSKDWLPSEADVHHFNTF